MTQLHIYSLDALFGARINEKQTFSTALVHEIAFSYINYATKFKD